MEVKFEERVARHIGDGQETLRKVLALAVSGRLSAADAAAQLATRIANEISQLIANEMLRARGDQQ